MASKNMFLDVNPSLIEDRLRLSELDDDDGFQSFVKNLEQIKEQDNKNNVPWKNVKPNAGFCVKTRTTSGEKIFINVCHTEDIPPPPRDISESELASIINGDGPSNYTLPMSIGDLHKELDKSGFQCSSYDVAINKSFFEKFVANKLLRAFFISVMLEGIQDKYKLEIDMNDYIILKNRKVMGTLQYHRIEQRPIREGPIKKKCLIEEVTESPIHTNSNPPPKFRIVKNPPEGEPEVLTAQVFIKNAISSKNLLLDVGEDRLLLHVEKEQASLLDIFLPYLIDQSKVSAQFNRETKMLTVTMPILNSG
uniref:PIH1 domain-containing protein 1 n=1 Tax=Clastoptera arizonana TaxID=38151 RepID=A0A1B6DWU8_9HEMI